VVDVFVRAGEPKMQTYAVDMNQCGPMILDALIKVSATPLHPPRRLLSPPQLCTRFVEPLLCSACADCVHAVM